MAATVSLNDAIKVLNGNGTMTTKRNKIIAMGFDRSETDRIISEYSRRWVPAPVRRAPYTFGIELEVYNVIRSSDMVAQAQALGLSVQYEAYNHTDNTSYYKFVRDGSIIGDGGIECVSPILTEGNGAYTSIKNICTALQNAGAKVNSSTGYHVHVGGEITEQQYINVFINYSRMQAMINMMVARGRRNCHWCRSLLGKDFSHCTTTDDVRLVLNNSRYHAVNPLAWARHRTIEFRQHQGTVNAKKVLAWAKFCIKLVDWSKDHVFDDYITSLDEVPFLTAAEKRYFKGRIAELNPATAPACPAYAEDDEIIL